MTRIIEIAVKFFGFYLMVLIDLKGDVCSSVSVLVKFTKSGYLQQKLIKVAVKVNAVINMFTSRS